MRPGTVRTHSSLASKAAGLVAVLVLLVVCAAMALGNPLADEESSVGAAAPTTSLPEPITDANDTSQSRSAEERRAKRVLTNGCAYTERGIPRCGVLAGAAYGGNADPLAWERSMGHRLGVRRTYWTGEKVPDAVAVAKDDLARQRLPWLSFKLPHSWEEMAAGRGDTWARELARQLSLLGGPVWVAFHHEPEGDGDIRAWTAMQERLAPIIRETAPNVAYSVILTGWHQVQGQQDFSLNSIWPDTRIDIAGFDVYNKTGMMRNGARIDGFTDFEREYFAEFRRFAKEKDMAWGLAETGQTHHSALVEPNWALRTYLSVLRYGGIAFTYFNSKLNSTDPWHLTGAKAEEFARVLRTTPTL